MIRIIVKSLRQILLIRVSMYGQEQWNIVPVCLVKARDRFALD